MPPSTDSGHRVYNSEFRGLSQAACEVSWWWLRYGREKRVYRGKLATAGSIVIHLLILLRRVIALPGTMIFRSLELCRFQET